MELERPVEKSGLGTGPLAKLGKLSSFLIRDSLRIARLAFVHVSAAEMMTEDATNTDEWGPTTKTLVEISNASKNYDDSERIVQVLRRRLVLTESKKWRQIFKALRVMEYLLTHGSEKFVMEFREDKKRLEELTRCVFVDENLVDRGSAVQSKAKHVIQLLVDESFFKEECRRVQTIAKGILGFGSQPVKASGDGDTLERPDFQKRNTYHDPAILKVEKAACIDCDRKNHDGYPPSPTSQRSTNWSASSTFSAVDSPQMSGASTEWNPFDESPTSESFTSSSSPIAGGWTSPMRDTFPNRKLSMELEMSFTASSRPGLLLKPHSPPLSKLLPPPKCRIPPPPPGGSKVGHNAQSRSSFPKPAGILPDFINL